MEFLNKELPEEFRAHFIKLINGEKTRCQDDVSYCYYDKDKDEFALNSMSVLSEEYEARVQYNTYHDGLYVFRALDERKELTASESTTLLTVDEHLKNTLLKTSFAEEMKQYCDYRDQKGLQYDYLMMDQEQKEPKLRQYYEALGGERIRALAYKESRLKNEMKTMKNDLIIQLKLNNIFKYGDELTATQIKEKMNSVFTEVGVQKVGKVSDLQSLYGFTVMMHNRTGNNGTRKRMYEITGIPIIKNNNES